MITSCAVSISPRLNSKSEADAESKSIRASWCGRDAHSYLRQEGIQVLDTMDVIAEALDKAQNIDLHRNSLEFAKSQLAGSDLLPSDRVFDGITKFGHLNLGLELAESYHNQRINRLLTKTSQEIFEQEACISIEKQIFLENNSTGSFSKYVQSYMTNQKTKQFKTFNSQD